MKKSKCAMCGGKGEVKSCPCPDCHGSGKETCRKILAVDFDKTLCGIGTYPDIGEQKFIHKIVLAYVKYKQKKGWTIIINTLREGNALLYVEEFCEKHNFKPDYYNENVPELIAKWGESRKIACSLNIDDTNIGLIGWILRNWGK